MTRGESMNAHLIFQFQDKKVLGAIVESLGEELDELETAFQGLKNDRWLDTAEGKQLDGIGEIVGQSRIIKDAIQLPFFGFLHQPNTLGFGMGKMRRRKEPWLTNAVLADEEYPMLIRLKIAINTTDGTMEGTIYSIQYIYKAEKVVVTDTGNASFSISIGKMLTPSEQVFASALNLLVRCGGVKLKEKSYFNPNGHFGFYGQPFAVGFGQGMLARRL